MRPNEPKRREGEVSIDKTSKQKNSLILQLVNT